MPGEEPGTETPWGEFLLGNQCTDVPDTVGPGSVRAQRDPGLRPLFQRTRCFGITVQGLQDLGEEEAPEIPPLAGAGAVGGVLLITSVLRCVQTQSGAFLSGRIQEEQTEKSLLERAPASED